MRQYCFSSSIFASDWMAESSSKNVSMRASRVDCGIGEIRSAEKIAVLVGIRVGIV